jgi:phage terminase Nu1 subunit (DNA packaging protein)
LNAVTKTELADALGYSLPTITNYVKQGMKAIGTGRGASARYDIAECHKWIVENAIKRTQKQSVNEPTRSTIEDAKLRREEANAQLAEIEVAQALGQLVSRDDATRELKAWMAPLQKKLIAIPSSWATFMVGHQSTVSAIAALKDRVNKLLDDLSTTEPDDYEEEELVEDEEVEDNE